MRRWTYDDGGRAAAGYKGDAGGCVTRAIAIAIGLPYQAVYDGLNTMAVGERRSSRRRGKSSARLGVYTPTIRKYIRSLGWSWRPVMGIGAGCTMHANPVELPPGRLILSLSRHIAAAIDGVIHDTSDPTRNGTRCVYGYWHKPTN